MSKIETVRYVALDGWRGLCACSVVFFHVKATGPLYQSTLIRNSYLFVDFFFVLSGFVISSAYLHRIKNSNDFWRFIFERISRIYPLHIAMLFCYLSFEIVRFITNPQNENLFIGRMAIDALFSNVLLIHSLNLHDQLTWNSPSWSISAEFWTYVLFGLLLIKISANLLIVLAIGVFSLIVVLIYSNTGMDVTYDYGLFRSVAGFCFGMACFTISKKYNKNHVLRLGWQLFSVLEICLLTMVILFVTLARDFKVDYFAPILFSIVVLVFSVELGIISKLLKTRPIAYLGSISYSVYLTHAFCITLSNLLLARILGAKYWNSYDDKYNGSVSLFGRSDLEGSLYFFAILIFTLVASIATRRWIEIPGQRILRRVFSKYIRH